MVDRNYEVGRGKPPEHGRFKPGQSGNPSGRPKRPPSLDALIEAELEREVLIEIGGERVWITNRDKIARRLVADMARGHNRPIEWYAKRQDQRADSPPWDEEASTEVDPQPSHGSGESAGISDNG